MKKSELKSYIREEIKSTLTVEDTQQDIKDTEELTVATQNLKKAKEEAGLEENGEKDHWADYTDIGMFYLEGFGKEHTLNDEQLELLGKKIVKQLYKGDVGRAYDELYKSVKGNELKFKGSLKEGNFDELKKYQKMLSDAADFYRKKAEELGVGDIKAFNKGINDLETAIFDEDNKRSGGKIDENVEEASYSNQYVDKNRIASNKYKQANDYKASYDSIGQVSSEKQFDDDNIDKKAAKGAKKNKGLAKAAEELALLTREMKSLAREYSKAEGEDKEKLVKTLKAKTKLKKELESILDNKKI